ncbi:unnamed protein product [Mytilus coruscus]|uniref:Uncharacterized protein n=1 Tax=Mytilus coruscus TaxID=42192 RepID=A0A6J8D7Y6_MYTCO|nr:unnamed protein product [Mytilus coruscus]
MKKIQFAKVAPLGVNPSEDYDKKGSSIQSECPNDLFRAKKGYQQTKLSFLTSVPPTLSGESPKFLKKVADPRRISLNKTLTKTMSEDIEKEFCSGDFNTSCFEKTEQASCCNIKDDSACNDKIEEPIISNRILKYRLIHLRTKLRKQLLNNRVYPA